MDEHLDVRRQLEMKRRHFELDMVQRRARTRRLWALGILLLAIAMAFLVSVANDYCVPVIRTYPGGSAAMSAWSSR